MESKKILLIGGSGYVGSKLREKLDADYSDVDVYDLPSNILDKDLLESSIKEVDVVYHLAALAELKYTDEHPEETYDVNITGLMNVIELCVKHDVLLNFISTCCIYGNPLELPSREDSVINPSDTYAMSKAAGEYLVKMFALSKGLRYNILRLGTVYGESADPKMRNDMCIQIFLRRVIKNQPLYVDGSGKQTRNYVHIEDLTNGLKLVTDKGIEGETFNFAGIEQISVLDIAHECMRVGREVEIIHRPERKDDFRYQMVSIEKSQRMLGWMPRKVFSESIKENYKQLREGQE